MDVEEESEEERGTEGTGNEEGETQSGQRSADGSMVGQHGGVNQMTSTGGTGGEGMRVDGGDEDEDDDGEDGDEAAAGQPSALKAHKRLSRFSLNKYGLGSGAKVGDSEAGGSPGWYNCFSWFSFLSLFLYFSFSFCLSVYALFDSLAPEEANKLIDMGIYGGVFPDDTVILDAGGADSLFAILLSEKTNLPTVSIEINKGRDM